MKKKSRVFIAAGYLGIIILTVIAVLIAGRRYTVYLNNPYGSDNVTIEYTVEGIVTNTEITNKLYYKITT